MRHSVVLAAFALVASACASTPSSSTPAASTAASGSATASASAAPNPCAGGTCRVAVEVDPQVAPQYQRLQVNYKLYQGCPRSLGASSVAGFRGLAPVTSSTQPMFTVPGTFTGRLATIVKFEGATPSRYVVVDFGANSTAAVNYGELWTGNALQDDKMVVNTNSSNERRLCR